jgi:hypothetical protein
VQQIAILAAICVRSVVRMNNSRSSVEKIDALGKPGKSRGDMPLV